MTAVGEVDVLTIDTLTEALDADLPAVTVLDLSGVTLLSAAGLRAVKQAVDRADRERRQIRLVASSRGVTWLLRMTNLDLHVPVYGSLPAAMREIGLLPG
jgi:anti-anti-sigma factor